MKIKAIVEIEVPYPSDAPDHVRSIVELTVKSRTEAITKCRSILIVPGYAAGAIGDMKVLEVLEECSPAAPAKNTKSTSKRSAKLK